jgi:serine protease Do
MKIFWSSPLACKGEVVRGFLGVLMQEVPPGWENRLGVRETGGVVISKVEVNTPAGQAGLRKGDVIVRDNEEPVGTINAVSQLRQRIARTPPDTTVPMEIIRGNRHMNLDVTIMKRPPL